MRRFVSLLVCVVITASAFGLATFVKPFNDNYKIKKGSVLEKAKCAVCHVGTKKDLNLYGKDLAKAMEAAKSKKITPEILKKIESLDSDKDGVKNGDEIRKDSLPGDAKAKPKS